MIEKSSTTPQPAQAVKPKAINWAKIILSAVLGFGLLLGAAFAGYWYGTQETSKLKEQISNLRAELADSVGQPKTQSQETLPPSGGTANWKLYENRTLGFSFRHPNLTEVGVGYGSDPIRGEDKFEKFLCLRDNVITGEAFNGICVSVSKVPISDFPMFVQEIKKTLLEWQLDYERVQNQLPTERVVGDEVVGDESEEVVIIGGVDSVKLDGYFIRGPLTIYLSQIPNNKRVLLIEKHEISDEYEFAKNLIFNQILSTFRFLD